MALPKKIRVAWRIGTVGALVLGLAIFSLFSDDPGAIYPELADRNFITMLMIFAAACIAIEQLIKRPYYRKLKEEKENGSDNAGQE